MDVSWCNNDGAPILNPMSTYCQSRRKINSSTSDSVCFGCPVFQDTRSSNNFSRHDSNCVVRDIMSFALEMMWIVFVDMRITAWWIFPFDRKGSMSWFKKKNLLCGQQKNIRGRVATFFDSCQSICIGRERDNLSSRIWHFPTTAPDEFENLHLSGNQHARVSDSWNICCNFQWWFFAADLPWRRRNFKF